MTRLVFYPLTFLVTSFDEKLRLGSYYLKSFNFRCSSCCSSSCLLLLYFYSLQTVRTKSLPWRISWRQTILCIHILSAFIFAVTASSPGYVSRTRTIALPNDKAVTVEFLLDPVTTSDTALGEHPLLRGSTRTRQKDQSFEEVASKETSDQTVSRSKMYNEPDKMSDSMSMEEADLVSGSNLDHLRLWVISSFGATVVVLAALMYVLIRWRGSFRSHVLRPATRRIWCCEIGLSLADWP